MSNDIEALLRATIQAKVVEAFNQTPAAIDKLVEAALSKEVNEHGGKWTYSDRSKMPYMEWLVGEEIRNAVRESMRAHIAENKTAILAKISEAINNGKYAESFSETIAKLLSNDYSWNVELKVAKNG